MTVNRYCASGFESIAIATAKIRMRMAECIDGQRQRYRKHEPGAYGWLENRTYQALPKMNPIITWALWV